jgi:hypothetical protein
MSDYLRTGGTYMWWAYPVRSQKVWVSMLVLSLWEGTVTPPDLQTPKHVDSQYHKCCKENFSCGDFDAMKNNTERRAVLTDDNSTLRRTTINQMSLAMNIVADSSDPCLGIWKLQRFGSTRCIQQKNWMLFTLWWVLQANGEFWCYLQLNCNKL